MKHLIKYNEGINKYGECNPVLDYNKETAIRQHLAEMIDIGWIEDRVDLDITTSKFDANMDYVYNLALDDEKLLDYKNKLDDPVVSVFSEDEYKKNPFYEEYTFSFSSEKMFSIEEAVEMMDSLSSAIERLKDDGFVVNVNRLSFNGRLPKGVVVSALTAHQFKISMYHIDDIVSYEWLKEINSDLFYQSDGDPEEHDGDYQGDNNFEVEDEPLEDEEDTSESIRIKTFKDFKRTI